MPSFALVAPYLPAPANTGGRIRMYHLARALARHGPVDLFARLHPVELVPAAGLLAPALEVYRRVYTALGDRGAVLPLVTSHRVRMACPRGLRADLARAHRAVPYDALVVCHSYALATTAGLDGVLVLDEHNIESAYARAVAPPGRWGGREARLLERWERRAWSRADLVTAVTDDEARAVRAHRAREARPPGTVQVVPNGVAVASIPYAPPSTRRGRDVLFIGAMSHRPNVAAAIELARDVLPRLRREFPDATVTLCGRAPAPEVRALASFHVRVTGTVDSVAPYLARASAYANLVRAGAGSSLKVPEAMAAGVPLVATRASVRGLAVEDGREALLVETAEECARAVASTWTDPVAADARAARARSLALALDWDRVGETFAGHVLAALRARGTA